MHCLTVNDNNTVQYNGVKPWSEWLWQAGFTRLYSHFQLLQFSFRQLSV